MYYLCPTSNTIFSFFFTPTHKQLLLALIVINFFKRSFKQIFGEISVYPRILFLMKSISSTM